MNTPHDFRPAILRYLKRNPYGVRLANIVVYLGAHDAWDRVQRALQRLRRNGQIEYDRKRWRTK